MLMQKTNEISDNELSLIVLRCNKASKGPWKSYVEGRDHVSSSNFTMTGVGMIAEKILGLLE